MSVRKRTWKKKDGRVSSCYMYDYFVNGVRRRIAFDHKPTIKELAQLEETVSKNPSFKEAVFDFINSNCKLHCKQSTLETYQNYSEVALKPLYPIKIKDFKRQHGERFILQMLETYSPKTVNNVLTFLKSFFNYLVDIKIISENPIKKIKQVRLKKSEVKALNALQMQSFVKHASQKPLWIYVFFMILLHMGLRISECIALEWGDVDFKKARLNINKQFYRYRITPTKNYETRILDIPLFLLELLKELYKTKTSDLVFNSSLINGKHVNVNNMRDRHFRSIINNVEEELDVDLDEITPHCLRHTHATFLLQNGVPVVAVSKRLGHRDCKTTLNIYNHCMPTDNEKIINLLDSLTTGTKSGTRKTETQQNQWRGVRVV